MLFGTTIALTVSQDARRLPAGASRSSLRRQQTLQIKMPAACRRELHARLYAGRSTTPLSWQRPPYARPQIATNVRLSPASGEHLAPPRPGVEANVRLSPASGEHLGLAPGLA